MHAYTHANTHARRHARTHSYTHTHTHTHTHTQMHTNTCTYTQHACMHTHTYAHTHAHAYIQIHTHTHTNKHTHTHTHTHTHIRCGDRHDCEKDSLEIVIEQVYLEGVLERGRRIRMEECLRQTVPDRWARVRKRSLTKCFCVYMRDDKGLDVRCGL